MAGGGKSGGTTTVEKADPWGGQQPYLLDIYSRAQGLHNAANAGYIPTFAEFSPQTQLALQLGENRALAGSPLTNVAQRNLYDIMQGGQGFTNLASPLTRQFENVILPGIEARASRSGRYGSNAMREGISGARADYAEGLGRLGLQSISMAPSLAAQDYADIAELSNIGATREAQRQREIDVPYTQLQRYMQTIAGLGDPGGSATSTAYRPSAGLNIGGGLGGAMAGYSAASALGASSLPWISGLGGPLGLGVGAAIGGGLGLFS